MHALRLAAAVRVRLAQLMTTHRCPEPGCPTSIRIRFTSAEEAQRLRKLAEDHSRHQSLDSK
ncbi:hypothetical protein M2271_007252 [Streptomyces sp. LBL]|uniref:hypothetical protein n=1 Tax=Streptomyces sp. LBL TaxID=2940562 RepID=UPI002473DC59|nr:hypothetical protein [Streptomyces sp. LBL]MDH6629416.1 hypothetical protein [Streptomyces sp. LBL]